MEFEERVSRGAVISPVQCLEYLVIVTSGSAEVCGAVERRGGGERKRQTHGDDIGVAYDSIGQREGDDDLEFERGHVTVHGDFLQCVEEAEVAALGWRFGRCPDCAQEGSWLGEACYTMSTGEGLLLTALVDDVERGVRDVVVFEQVFGRA